MAESVAPSLVESVDVPAVAVKEASSGAGASEAVTASTAVVGVDPDDEEEDEDENDAIAADVEAVSRDELLAVMSELRDAMKAKIGELKQAVEDGLLAEEQCAQEIEKAGEETQREVCGAHGFDQEAISKAIEKHERDPEVKKVLRSMRDQLMPEEASRVLGQIDDLLGAEQVVPEDMTVDKLVRLIRQNTEISVRIMQEQADKVLKENSPSPDTVQKFAQSTLQRAPQSTRETFEEMGIKAGHFAASMMRFQGDPKVQEAEQSARMSLLLVQQQIQMRLGGPEFAQRLQQMQQMQMMAQMQ